MKQNSLLRHALCGILLLVPLPNIALAQTIDLSQHTTTNQDDQLAFRLDNIQSALQNIDFVLNHLDKNIVVFQAIPLSESHTSYEDVLNYGISAVTESLNFNYTTFRHALAESSEFYSAAAYQQLQNFLKSTDVLNKTKARKITNHAVIMAPAIITGSGVEKMPHPNIANHIRDVFTWHLEFPLFIQAFSNGELMHTMTKTVTIKVVRSSVEHSAEQMLIADIQFDDNKLGV